jgi:hypothetical protein
MRKYNLTVFNYSSEVYSISIRVIIIYRLIQELGSIRLILALAIGLHLPLQVIVAYKIGIPPIHY